MGMRQGDIHKEGKGAEVRMEGGKGRRIETGKYREVPPHFLSVLLPPWKQGGRGVAEGTWRRKGRMKKGSTDYLINDNATLIDEYGSIDFLDTVRGLVVKAVLR